MEKTNMKNLYFILMTLCFFGGMFLSANAADMSIDMLNKKGIFVNDSDKNSSYTID